MFNLAEILRTSVPKKFLVEKPYLIAVHSDNAGFATFIHAYIGKVVSRFSQKKFRGELACQ